MPEENTLPLYEVAGLLPKGFQGHITYTTALPQGLRELRATFTFDQREPTQELEQLQADCRAALRENLPEEPPAPLLAAAYRMPKAEINVSLFLNGQCLGSAHRNTLVKELALAPEGSSAGFVSCRPAGVLQVVLHALNILNDSTHYSLCIRGIAE